MSSVEEYFVFSGFIRFTTWKYRDVQNKTNSCKLFRDRKFAEQSETFYKTQTRWIGYTKKKVVSFDLLIGTQRKIIYSGGVTTLNPDSLEIKENVENYNPKYRWELWVEFT